MLMQNPLDRMFDDGLPDTSPLWKAVRANPRRVLNPVDLVWDLARSDYFKKTRFDVPAGDPGWFGPDSAAWYVHMHTPTLFLGLVNTAMIDIIHQDIQYAVFDHSKLVGRDAYGKVIPGTFSSKGTLVRAGRTFSFFAGMVYGSTDTAEELSKTVKAIHHTVKGVRPDGKSYDADEPEFFRWTYASVVDGIAGAHERYHPRPLEGAQLDQFYREYAKVGEALGGTDLPQTKAECQKLLVTSPSANSIALNVDNIDYIRPPLPLVARPLYNFFFWLIMDMMPLPVQKVVSFTQPNPVKRRVYQTTARILVRTISAFGEIQEVKQARRRIAVRASSH